MGKDFCSHHCKCLKRLSPLGTLVIPQQEQRNVGLEMAGPSSSVCCDQAYDCPEGVTESKSCIAIHSSPQNILQYRHPTNWCGDDKGMREWWGYKNGIFFSISSWLKTRLIPKAGLFVHLYKVNHWLHSSFHGINIYTYTWQALK